MKCFNLFFLLLAASLGLAFASVVREETDVDECEGVPALVAYCLDLLHLGAEYEPQSPEVDELKHDVEQVPLGMCAWGDWNGRATVEDCMQILSQYADMYDEEDDGDQMMEVDASGRFLKKLGKKIKKAAKKVVKGAKKVVKGVKKVVKKVSKFCKKNKKVCKAAVEVGKAILSDKKSGWAG